MLTMLAITRPTASHQGLEPVEFHPAHPAFLRDGARQIPADAATVIRGVVPSIVKHVSWWWLS